MQVACVSTFPPRQCGLATFAEDLVEAIDGLGKFPPVKVVAVSRRGVSYAYPTRVWREIVQEDRQSYLAAAQAINRAPIDLVLIQHEYGIYGGSNGSYLLTLLASLQKPAVATFHTVLVQPHTHQRSLLQEIASTCSAVVVPAEKGREILVRQYKISPSKIRVIHHGVPPALNCTRRSLEDKYNLHDRTILCTFGLIHPGKGLEYAISALPQVVARHPEVLYLILGETHPEVKRHSGEAYREYLEGLVNELDLANHVLFVNRYLPKEELLEYLTLADLYVTPYLSEEQICSGTLAYAVSMGKAVISTPYFYAREILADGRGCLVPFKDSQQLADTINFLLEHPQDRERMQASAWEFGRQMLWPEVGRGYTGLFREALEAFPQPLAT
ncbi:MAG: glycosyltransferase [Clostridia bacterium]|nr:MAG: glycosyltransferase [Clostridia bacterium]